MSPEQTDQPYDHTDDDELGQEPEAAVAVDDAPKGNDYDGWPFDDPQHGSDKPQPWDLNALGLSQAAAELEPGAPNTVAPVVIEHSYPILVSGSSDPSVQELGRRLAKLGYANSVSRGENPFGVVDETIMAAVHGFRQTYNVQEDPSGFGGDIPYGRQRAESHIGPWTWEAIVRASDRD